MANEFENKYSKLFGTKLADEHRSDQLLFHPDRPTGDSDKFVQLQEAYDKFKYKDTIGDCDQIKLLDGTTKHRLGLGHVSAIYQVENHPLAFYKLALHPSSSDLLEREFIHLTQIDENWSNHFSSSPSTAPAIETYAPIPSISDYLYSGVTRRFVAKYHGYHSNDYVSLLKLRHLFPEGIPVEHCRWIIRRILRGLRMAHEIGIMHGSICPHHIIVYPQDHEILIIDWTNSGKSHESLQYINDKIRPFVIPGEKLSPESDLHSIRTLARWMGETDEELISTIVGDADKAHTQMGLLLTKKYGRDYKELVLPK